MSRAMAVIAACLLLCGDVAWADSIDTSVKETTSKAEKVRLEAVLALAKSKDARAVLAVSSVVNADSDAKIRRIAALALEKMVDAKTADDARSLAIESLEKA